MFRLTIFLAVFLALHPAFGADDRLAKADKLFNELEYDQAIDLAEQILQSPDAGPEELVQAYRIKGLSLSGKDQIEDAYLMFRELVAINPHYRISSDVSPRLAAPFYQAVATAVEFGAIELVHQAPTGMQTLAGAELTCSMKANPFGMIHSIRLRYRTPSQELTVDAKQALEKKTTLTFKLPEDLTADAVLYHFEALNRNGGVLARSGSGAQPHRLQTTSTSVDVEAATGETSPTESAALAVEPVDPDAAATDPVDSSPVWYKTWWFWTAVGAVVVVGATATAIGISVGGGSDTDTYHFQFQR